MCFLASGLTLLMRRGFGEVVEGGSSWENCGDDLLDVAGPDVCFGQGIASCRVLAGTTRPDPAVRERGCRSGDPMRPVRASGRFGRPRAGSCCLSRAGWYATLLEVLQPAAHSTGYSSQGPVEVSGRGFAPVGESEFFERVNESVRVTEVKLPAQRRRHRYTAHPGELGGRNAVR